MAARYKRGDKSPSDAQLFFWRYNRGKETWIPESELTARIANAQRKDKLWKKTDKGLACQKRGWQRSNVKHRLEILAYYKRADVRQRIRDKHNSKPDTIAKRETRLQWRAEREAYRKSDEFKSVLKKRNRKNWLKRKAAGKTREYDRNRWQNDLQYRLASNMRRLVHQAITRLSGTHKHAKTFNLIGCSISALRVHLEAQFVEGMSWENYGSEWHVDHFVPISLFDLNDDLQQRQAFYFENLKPLWKADNHSKSDKVEIEGKQVRARDIRKIIPFKAA